MEQSVEPPNAETLEELGTKLGKLRYDALGIVLSELVNELSYQARDDVRNKRFELAICGEDVRIKIREAGEIIKVFFPHNG